MKQKIYLAALVIAVSLLTFPLSAPAYEIWSQSPDWRLGFDIPSFTPYDNKGGMLVADDFSTDNTGNPIIDLHWWGSYMSEPGPFASPATNFWVGFWTDVPAGSGHLDYSYPGIFLKSYDFTNLEGKLDGYQEWTQHNGYYYSVDFSNDPLPVQPNTIYWVSILESIDPEHPSQYWGWKTSDQHWNDDAVSLDIPAGTPEPIPGTLLTDIGIPQELRYPAGHPYEGQSVDMAFKVTAAPEPVSTLLFITGGALLAGRRTLRRKKA